MCIRGICIPIRISQWKKHIYVYIYYLYSIWFLLLITCKQPLGDLTAQKYTWRTGGGSGVGNVCMRGIEPDSSTYTPLLWLVIRCLKKKGTLRWNFTTLSITLMLFHHPLPAIIHFSTHPSPSQLQASQRRGGGQTKFTGSRQLFFDAASVLNVHAQQLSKNNESFKRVCQCFASRDIFFLIFINVDTFQRSTANNVNGAFLLH